MTNVILVKGNFKYKNLKRASSEPMVLLWCNLLFMVTPNGSVVKKVQVGKDQEKAQSEKDSHSKNRGGEK